MKFNTPMKFAEVKRIARTANVDVTIERSAGIVADARIVTVDDESNGIWDAATGEYLGRCIVWGASDEEDSLGYFQEL